MKRSLACWLVASVLAAGPVALFAAENPSTLVAGDVLIFVRVSSLAKLKAELQGIDKATEQEEPGLAASAMKMVGERIGKPDLEGVDLDAPLAFAVIVGKAPEAPAGAGDQWPPAPAAGVPTTAMVLLVPIEDEAAFRKGWGGVPPVNFGEKMEWQFVGGYLVSSTDAAALDALKPGGQVRWATAAQGTVTAVVDMAKVDEVYGQMVKEQLQGFRMMAAMMGQPGMMPPDADPKEAAQMMAGVKMILAMADFGEQVLDQSKAFEYSASADKGALKVQIDYVPRTDSSFAKSLAKEKPGPHALVSRLPADSLMAFGVKLSPDNAKLVADSVMKFYLPIFLAMLPPEEAVKAQAALKELLDATSYETAAAMLPNPDGGGLRGVSYNRYVKPVSIDSVLAVGELSAKSGAEMGGPSVSKATKIAEPYKGYSMCVIEMKAPEGEPRDMQEKMNRAMYEAIMPRQTAYGVKDTTAITAMGPDALADLKAAIDSYEAGKKPLEGTKLMTAAGELATSSNGLAVFSVGDFVKLINKVMASMPGTPPEVENALKDLKPSNSATAVGLVIQDSRMQLKIMMPAAEVAQLAEIIRRFNELDNGAAQPVIIEEPVIIE